MLYFAYGSNLLTARLVERTPSARVIGAAVLPGFEIAFDKRSENDGSAKCRIGPDGRSDSRVEGVVYSLARDELRDLDRIEGVGSGYDREAVEVEVHGRVTDPADRGLPSSGLHAVESVEVVTYVGLPRALEPGLRPFDWYVDLCVGGAREHGLSRSWLDWLRSIEAMPDPHPGRSESARGLLKKSPGALLGSSSD